MILSRKVGNRSSSIAMTLLLKVSNPLPSLERASGGFNFTPKALVDLWTLWRYILFIVIHPE
jgi:surface polysaccharide O-acyltransferase-like enzyme